MRDRALVDRVRVGDDRAFAELYRAYAPGTRKAARDFVHDRETLDDVVQETFTRALRKLDLLRDGGKVGPWLYQIARNAARDVLRGRGREFVTEGGGVVLDRASPELGPEDLAELEDLTRLVDRALVALSTRDVIAVVMMTGFGFSSADVAAVLAISPGAAKVAAHRAKRRLREALVVQLLLRTRRSDCDELDRLLAGRDVLGAARHAGDCSACQRTAAGEAGLRATR